MVVAEPGRWILYLSQTYEAKVHDKRIVDEEALVFGPPVAEQVLQLLQDTGFQGYKPSGVELVQPMKKPRGKPLTEEQKASNRAISSQRVVVEQAIGGGEDLACGEGGIPFMVRYVARSGDGARLWVAQLSAQVPSRPHTKLIPYNVYCKHHRWVLVRDPSLKLKPKAFLCTDLAATPLAILSWFVRRWQVEVTFEEVRRHLGVESQRQWSDLAIARTTPCLLGLFSVVTLLAHQLYQGRGVPVRQASWYCKTVPSFSDALAAVRGQLWRQRHYWLSGPGTETMKIPKPLFESMTEALCYAA